MAKPPTTIHHLDTARSIDSAEAADGKSADEAKLAAKVHRLAQWAAVVLPVVAILLYRVIVGHFATLLTTFVGIVLVFAAIPIARSAMDVDKAGPPWWWTVLRRDVMTDAEQREARWGDTGHYTPEGSAEQLTNAASKLNGREIAVKESLVMTGGGILVYVWGFATLAMEPAVAVIVTLAVVIAGANVVKS